jgi:predicted RecB family endonuclease
MATNKSKIEKKKNSIAQSIFEDTPIDYMAKSNEVKERVAPQTKEKLQPIKKLQNNEVIVSKGKKGNEVLDVLRTKVIIEKKILTHIDASTHKKMKLLASITNTNMYEVIENILRTFLKENEKEINVLIQNNFK